MAANSSACDQDLQIPPPQPSSRRLPPPCWSDEETVALIDAYREKWYSLRRGNLRASHWQQVAETVAFRCPTTPQKTSVQCRHKMEKLRKRYRSEIQRSAGGRHRFNSSWLHFNRMDCMEKGPTAVALPLNTTPDDENEDDDQDDDFDYREKVYVKNGGYGNSGIGNSWYRNPGRVNVVSPTPLTMYNNKFHGYTTTTTTNPNANCVPNGKKRVEKKEKDDPLMELVGAVKALGDGFLRMERMKMDMVREVEAMRVDMEVKKTEMILESQQRVLETFVDAVSERKNKKAKTMSATPPPS